MADAALLEDFLALGGVGFLRGGDGERNGEGGSGPDCGEVRDTHTHEFTIVGRMRPVVILYAKAPEPGRVKTRLARSIGGAAAASLHEAFVGDMLERLAGLAGRADVELHTDIETDAWREFAVTRGLQPAGDLGARMLGTLREALVAGREVAAIVGSDAPTLPVAIVEGLIECARDVAIGASEDGGYWGIAARRVDERMFGGVEWSSGRECEQTIVASRECGLTVARAGEWWDVDTVEELRRLVSDGNLPPRTAAWVKGNEGTL